MYNDEVDVIQQMLKQKKFKHSNELYSYIMGFEHEKITGQRKKRSVGYIPRREQFVPTVPEHERC